MNCQHIPDRQTIFRCIHYPSAFDKKKGQLNLGKSWYLQRNGREISTSVVWQRFAPAIEMVHAYGCRNSERRRSRNFPDIYCGFYAINVNELRAVPPGDGILTIDVHHKIEGGEIAHADLIVNTDGSVDDDQIEDVKSFVMDRLWRLMRGPVRFNDGGGNVDGHPSSFMKDSTVPYQDDRDGFNLVVDWVWYYSAGRCGALSGVDSN